MEQLIYRDRVVASGTSTGQMLRALGEAILHPSEYITFKDHFQPTTYHSTVHCRDSMRHIIRKLGLRDMEVDICSDGTGGWAIRVISRFRSLAESSHETEKTSNGR